MALAGIGAMPARASLRVTLLGDGFGECVVVETRERVAVVDSARGPTGEPLALTYLASAERSADEVDLLVATHFDLDHVGGLRQLAETLQPQRLVVSGVFRNEELLAELAMERRLRSGEDARLPSRAAEYVGALEAVPPKARFFAGEGSTCRRWRGADGEVVFNAWAPATETIRSVHRRIARLMTSSGGDARVLGTRVFEENETSIVLSVHAPGTEVILGGDLERSADDARGWKRAVAIGKELFSFGSADVIKAPHHGSQGSFDEAVWDFASKQCVALVAPWVRGKGALPTRDGIRQLVRRASEVWLTVDPEDLPVGPGGGRVCAPRVCWTQATYDGTSWDVGGGVDAKPFRSTPVE